jgi:NADPH2:quinone reductase
LAGPVPMFNTSSLLFRRLKIGGVAIGAYANAESHAAWKAVLELLSKTGARPLIDRVFLFEELPKAFERLSRGPMGKVLLRVN